MYKRSILFIALSCTAGCASIPDRSPNAALSMEGVERRCGLTAHKFSAYHLADQPSKSSSSTVEKEFPISAPVGFSDQALAIAGTIGVLPLMQHLSVLEAEAVQDKEVTSLHLIQTRQQLSEVRHQLSDLVLSALFQVVNTAAAVHCEEERANLSANHLQELQDKGVVQDTIFAILGGAAVGVVSGGLSLAAYPTAAAISAISGGALEATFGFKALFFESQSANDRHGVDLLREVSHGPEQSSRFPVSVWRFLNRPLPENPAGRSARELLVIRWQQHGWLGEPGSETANRRKTLFFEQGGMYELEDFRAKAGMLDLLESDIMLMAQELQILLHEVASRNRSSVVSDSVWSLSGDRRG